MYCDNAQKYKPIVASISWSGSSDTKQTLETENSALESAKEKCNSLITSALISRSDFDVQRRDVACKKYRELKGK